ncbi:MAG: DUF3667 domain-containing protein [Bacteroidota bacterium]
MICVDCSKELVVGASHCHHCGSRIIYHRLNFRDLLVDLFQRVTNLERGLWPTLRDMTVRPGQVCLGYIGGMRKRYTPPATYALIVGSLYAILSLINSEIYFYEALMDGIFIGGADAESDAAFLEKFRPFRLPLLFLPVLVITIVNKLFYRRQFNWAEQAVVALYYYAHFLLVFLVLHLSVLLIDDFLSDDTPYATWELVLNFALYTSMVLGYKLYVYNKVYRHGNKLLSIIKPILAFLVGCILNFLPYLGLTLYFLRGVD